LERATTVETFVRREDADRVVDEVRGDDPSLRYVGLVRSGGLPNATQG
jgi:hypothetical protein